MTKDQLKSWIKHYEGFNGKAYMDSRGRLTIGWGRNIQEVGITPAEGDYLFDNDIAFVEKVLLQHNFYLNAPGNVKDALFNMCFNLGINGLLEFKDMIKAIEDKNYSLAAKAALASSWAMEVGKRAKDIALMISETSSA